MKILQVLPNETNVIINNIILNYKLNLEKKGHIVDIGYNVDIMNKEYDIIHVYSPYDAKYIMDKGMNYIYSLCNHVLEKNDYRYNIINKSIITITNNKDNIEIYNKKNKLFYIEHNLDILDWKNITNTIEKYYYMVLSINENYDSNIFNIKMKNIYEDTLINFNKPIEKEPNIIVDYRDGVTVHLISYIDNTYDIEFIDDEYNKILYRSTISNGMWTKPLRKFYTKWKINVINKNDRKNIKVFNLDLDNKNVFIDINSNHNKYIENWLDGIYLFKKKHNCNIYCQNNIDNNIMKKYNEIYFIDNDEKNKIYFYASYKIDISDDTNILPLYDIEKCAHYILGV